MYPRGREAENLAALERDFAAGGHGTTLRAMLAERSITSEQIQSFLGCVADVRAGFKALNGREPFQASNWMHTRIEILHALEAAKVLGLTGDQALVTVLGSLFSDSIKDISQHSLLVHNRMGAEIALPLIMGRHFDLREQRNRNLLKSAMRVAHEHQITPPGFMAMAVRQFVASRTGVAEDDPWLKEIHDKIANPMAAPQSDGEMVFSDEAEALMRQAGIPGWAVPCAKDPNFKASLATIYGDIAQYVGADGLDKIARIMRGPTGPAFNRSTTLRAAVEATLQGGFDGGLEAIREAIRHSGAPDAPQLLQAINEHAASQRAACVRFLDDRVYPAVEKLLREQAPDGDIPYWTSPVIAAEDGSWPSEAEKESTERVQKIFGEVLAKEGPIPWDLFV
jgi:hypothetical protein